MADKKNGSGHFRLAMPIEQAMRTQRAIRRFKTDPVDDDLLLLFRSPSTRAARRRCGRAAMAV